LFDRRPAPAVPAARLLLGAIAVEALCVFVVRELPLSLSIKLPGLLAVSLTILLMSGVRLTDLGFRPWSDWSATERSWFVQVLIIANLVFPLVLLQPIMARLQQGSMAQNLLTVFVPYLFFGFYQEVVYRGMLQSSLERWLGALLAVVVANVLFTFGPLHWYYVTSRNLPMLGAIFAIGLYFGVLYQRSRNLWLPAVFHAIGNAYMVWGLGSR
jgi:membrane protease YdiL (CAAX protease family)